MRRAARAPVLLSLLSLALPACEGGGGGGIGEDVSEYCDAQRDWPAESEQFEFDVLDIVNEHRANGFACASETFGPAAPLVMDPSLRCAARNHSADMAIRDYFAHDTPDGESFVDRVNKTDYAGSPAGENIALGFPDPEAVMAGWMSSDGHCRNIMNPNHTQIGIGHFGEGPHWTQVMGRE